jgi:outer membrane receptor for ferrienterochelin and colicins
MRTTPKHIFFTLIFIIIFIFNCFGQNRIISGKIIDANTNLPISGINVTLQDSNYSSVTKNDGSYKITLPENISIIEFAEFAEKKIAKKEIISTNEINIYVSDFSEDEIYKLSLSDLMNIKVEVASKINEPENEAPGVVSVVTAKEIEAFGATSLRDILERVTGVIGLTGYVNRNVISMRGDLTLASSGHILAMINGRPIRESIVPGSENDIYGMFPLNCIEQIEVIRGPGSVLYGTNAYTGVINIVTKHKNEYFSAGVSSGLPNSTLASVSGGSKLGKGILSGGIYYKNLRNWQQSFTTESDVDTSFNTQEKGMSAILSYHQGGVAVNTSLILWNNFLIAPNFGGNYANQLKHFIDIGYVHPFSSKVKTSINATNTYVYHDGLPLHPRRISNYFLTEITTYIKPNQKLNIIAGWCGSYISGISESLVNNEIIPSMPPKYGEFYYSIYGQVNYKFTQTVKVISGFQVYQYAQNIKPKFIPRLGFIWSPTEKIIVKTLYAEAYRSPTASETNFISPRLIGNPNLRPESVRSFDLEFIYSDKKIQPSLTFFINRQYDIISRDNNSNPQSQINKGAFSAQGLEFEMKFIPTKKLFLNGSCSYQTNVLNDSIKNSTTAAFTAKLGISYSTNSGLSIGIFNIYNSTPPDVIMRNPSRKLVNPVPAAFNLLSANIDYNLAKILLKTKTDIILNLRAENLLNVEIFSPEWVRSRINSIPGKPGRIFYVGLKVSF